MPETHAIVIGGSIAGMCAASVLRRSFTKVTLLDRDALPDDATPRAGVPQARHAHVLLERGWVELERLFPGFQARMREGGAQIFDQTMAIAILRPMGWQRRIPSGVVSVLASRDRTESTLRGMLRVMPGVSITPRMEVTELLTADRDPSRVAGVRATPRDGGAAAELFADLVVDASGRASKVPSLVQSLGFPAPPETVVDSFAGYSTRWYKMPPEDRWPKAWWWTGAWVDAVPPAHPLGAVLFPADGRRWVLTLFGHAKHYPPSDEEGFAAALRGLASPVVAETVALGEPVSPVISSRALVNRFRHYERARALPAGFIAIGDGVCVQNPVHGQGMSVAALSAGALLATLERAGAPSFRSRDFPRVFFEAQARALADPWELATVADFRFPETVGERPLGTSLLRVYQDLMTSGSIQDPQVLRRVWPIFHMMKPASELRDPDLVARILLLSLRGAARRLSRGAPAIPPMPPPAEGASGDRG